MTARLEVLLVLLSVAQQVTTSTGLPAPFAPLHGFASLNARGQQGQGSGALPRALHPQQALCELRPDREACSKTSGCSWCESGDGANKALPSMCFSTKYERNLPSSTGYTCTTPSTSAAEADPLPDACMALKTQDVCDANATCTWCAASAIPSECLSKTLASHLPPGVFQCDGLGAAAAAATVASQAEDTCLPHHDQEACLGAVGCEWCKSEAPQLEFCLKSELTSPFNKLLGKVGAVECKAM